MQCFRSMGESRRRGCKRKLRPSLKKSLGLKNFLSKEGFCSVLSRLRVISLKTGSSPKKARDLSFSFKGERGKKSLDSSSNFFLRRVGSRRKFFESKEK